MDIYKFNDKYYFEYDSIEGQIIIGKGRKSTGETYPYISHIETYDEITEEQYDKLIYDFEKQIHYILNLKNI